MTDLTELGVKAIRDAARDVAALKESEGGDILVYGSATLAKALLRHGLADELRLMMFPLTIGGGLRLFDDNRQLQQFMLKRSITMSNGVLLAEYEPGR